MKILANQSSGFAQLFESSYSVMKIPEKAGFSEFNLDFEFNLEIEFLEFLELRKKIKGLTI